MGHLRDVAKGLDPNALGQIARYLEIVAEYVDLDGPLLNSDLEKCASVLNKLASAARD